jgi:cytochrome c oxidase cbb3-type subunit 3/ubiquinol-cytochrome c reductase cytochrome c subunit
MLRPPLSLMLVRHQLIASLAVVVASIGGGSLECNPRRPLTPTEAHGAALYGRMCAVCHGREGEGYKADHAPAIAHPDFLASVSDEFLRSAITHGRAGTTMSAWGREHGGPLERTDVDHVIAFLHSREEKVRVRLDEHPLHGEASRGNDVFARDCQACHGARGMGGKFVSVGNRDLLATASDGFLRYAIRGGRPDTEMPAFGIKLGDSGIDDILAAMRAWQTTAPTTPPPPPAKPPPIPLGPVPLNPKGPEPVGFNVHPQTTGVEAVKAQLDRGARMALLDSRDPAAYMGEHIAGAVSTPFYDPTPYFADLPKDAWLICYCACPTAESMTLAQKLMAAGFKKVTVLAEGLGGWRGKKYPTHSGMDP